MHAIMIKRLGHNVQILDQSLTSTRTDHAPDMGTGPQGLEFFQKYNSYKEPYSFACPGVRFLDKHSHVKRTLSLPLNLTSWAILYYRLRANLDALMSEFYPEPLIVTEADGLQHMTWARERQTCLMLITSSR